MRITKNLEDLRNRISAACAAAGRSENDVSILAVSKRHSIESIREAAAAGLRSMGENYVQEAIEKISQLGPEIEWHYIGRIQTNKTRLIAENFDWAQTVDSEKIARRLSSHRPNNMAPLNVCLQIDIDGTGQHGGIPASSAQPLCKYIDELPRLKLRGLMTIPAPRNELDEQRQSFALLKGVYDDLLANGFKLDTLSMGMTNDLEAAILEGSTMIRVGTALFGPRPVE
jgi:pyridoxal phosphate enzyme (YggS family)